MGKWKLENFQREQIRNGLTKCNEEDIIMVSDLDEIPRAEKIQEMISLLEQSKKVGFKQKLFNHYLNGYVHDNWVGTKAVKFKTLKKELRNNPQKVRLRTFHYPLERLGIHEKIEIISKGGWHFNNIGKKEEIKEKILSKAESDLFKGNLNEEVEKKFNEKLPITQNSLKIVDIDNTFPKEVLKNRKRYNHLICLK